ncbi:MAG: YdjY domain-containing protein [Planctomycetota bacterium]
MTRIIIVLSVLLLSACHAPPREGADTASATATEVFPGVTLNAATRTVTFDAVVPNEAHDAPAWVLLESVVCTPNTREHETLLVADVRPSHVHAALLAIGLEPGEPGGFAWTGSALEPRRARGPRLIIAFEYASPDGAVQFVEPQAWIVRAGDGAPFPDRLSSVPQTGWLFAGSEIIDGAAQRDVPYAADREGTLIGLSTFGSETITWAETWTPESAYAVVEWVANPDTIPPAGTLVTVHIRPEAQE